MHPRLDPERVTPRLPSLVFPINGVSEYWIDIFGGGMVEFAEEVTEPGEVE